MKNMKKFLKLIVLCAIFTGATLCMQQEKAQTYLELLPSEIREEIKLFAEDATLRALINEAIEKSYSMRAGMLRPYIQQYPAIVAQILEKKFTKEYLSSTLIQILEGPRIDLNTVKVLLLAGANPNAKNLEGKSALELATKSFSPNTNEVIKMLLAYGADPNTYFSNNVTPLFYAALNGETEQVQMLLEAGAKVHKKFTSDQLQGQSALELVQAEDYWENNPIRATIEEAAIRQIAE